jgi:hypothetical protein
VRDDAADLVQGMRWSTFGRLRNGFTVAALRVLRALH